MSSIEVEIEVVSPKIVCLFYGKRKSGKDYVVSRFVQMYPNNVCHVIRLSAPLKEQYAKNHDLDYKRLLDSSPYKEEHRLKMITWGVSLRDKDPGYFCCLATQDVHAPVWLVSDCRRPTDVEYFKKHYSNNTLLICVSASESVRVSRGWSFVSGVDDAPSECALDDYSCDCHVINDGQEEKLLEHLIKLKEIIDKVSKNH